MYFCPVLGGEVHVGERVGLSAVEQFCELWLAWAHLIDGVEPGIGQITRDGTGLDGVYTLFDRARACILLMPSIPMAWTMLVSTEPAAAHSKRLGPRAFGSHNIERHDSLLDRRLPPAFNPVEHNLDQLLGHSF